MNYDDLQDYELKDLEFEDINDNTNANEWKPEQEGDFIIGRYITTEKGSGKGADYLFHYIRDTESQERSIFGCTVLNRQLERVEPGDIIKIIYDGLKTSQNGRQFKAFRIQKPKQQ